MRAADSVAQFVNSAPPNWLEGSQPFSTAGLFCSIRSGGGPSRATRGRAARKVRNRRYCDATRSRANSRRTNSAPRRACGQEVIRPREHVPDDRREAASVRPVRHQPRLIWHEEAEDAFVLHGDHAPHSKRFQTAGGRRACVADERAAQLRPREISVVVVTAVESLHHQRAYVRDAQGRRERWLPCRCGRDA